MKSDRAEKIEKRLRWLEKTVKLLTYANGVGLRAGRLNEKQRARGHKAMLALAKEYDRVSQSN